MERSPTKLFRRVWLLNAAMLAAMLMSSCGRTTKSALEKAQVVDFIYEISKSRHSLGELGGRPLVLVLMRTSELPSHVYIREVKVAFQKTAGRTRFLVLTVEPHEAPFTEIYAEAEELPFPIGVADRSVALGQTALGRLPLIPVTYLLNPSRVIVQTVPGAVSAQVLMKQIDTYLHQ